MADQDKQRLGDLLLEANLIDEVQLRVALKEQQDTGERLGSALVHMGFIDESVLAAFLSKQFDLPCVNVNGLHVPADVLQLISKDLATDMSILPVRRTGDKLYLAMTDPFDDSAAVEASKVSGLEVVPMIAPEFCLKQAIDRFYAGSVVPPPVDELPRESMPGFENLMEEMNNDEVSILASRIEDLATKIELLTLRVSELSSKLDDRDVSAEARADDD